MLRKATLMPQITSPALARSPRAASTVSVRMEPHSSSDRALGSLAGPSTACAFGVRFTNATTSPQSNIIVFRTGEQWRAGSSSTPQASAFSWRVTCLSHRSIPPCQRRAPWSDFPQYENGGPFLSRLCRSFVWSRLNALPDHVLDQVSHTATITPLVVVPAHEFEELLVQFDA